MSLRVTNRRWLLTSLLCFLCASLAHGIALDREAFTFTVYDLKLELDPMQHRLGARGKITVRNDSTVPQRNVTLQISSSLDWRSIRVGDRPVQFTTHLLTSDIDHTGGLSEAIVSLPEPVAPKATVELEIGYEGVIVQDATRLTRIGTPEDAAQSAEWDEIGPAFTAVRGAGYVAWYPIATEVANLSEGDSVFEVLGRWQARVASARMQVAVSLPNLDNDARMPAMLCDGRHSVTQSSVTKLPTLSCMYETLGMTAPSFVITDDGVVTRPSITVYNAQSHAVAAEAYAEEAEKLIPFISDWFGAQREKAITVDLDDSSDAPFESGALLLAPLRNADASQDGLAVAYQLTHGAFWSARPWIGEGLAHFAQALYIEHEKGRQDALAYMGTHRAGFVEDEATSGNSSSNEDASRSLADTMNQQLYRSKAMYVWWMLRDLVGDAALKKALAAYRPDQDKDAAYVQRLIKAEAPRDLQWFFEDWVYHDRGLPDFKIESAFAAKTSTGTYLVTLTVDNLGTAAAEVPVIVKFAAGVVTKRLEIHAKEKSVIRVETASAPQEIVVNDGSVPETDMTNNTFRFDAGDAGK
jgi:hypothetical protein